MLSRRVHSQRAFDELLEGKILYTSTHSRKKNCPESYFGANGSLHSTSSELPTLSKAQVYALLLRAVHVHVRCDDYGSGFKVGDLAGTRGPVSTLDMPEPLGRRW